MSDDLRTEITQLVSEIIEIPVEEIDPEKDLADMEVDSMKALEIVAAIEKKFKVVVPEEQIPQARTVNKIIGLAKQLKESK